jgi:hypothetical protein
VKTLVEFLVIVQTEHALRQIVIVKVPLEPMLEEYLGQVLETSAQQQTATQVDQLLEEMVFLVVLAHQAQIVMLPLELGVIQLQILI